MNVPFLQETWRQMITENSFKEVNKCLTVTFANAPQDVFIVPSRITSYIHCLFTHNISSKEKGPCYEESNEMFPILTMLLATVRCIFNNCCRCLAAINKVILAYSVNICFHDHMTSSYFSKMGLHFSKKRRSHITTEKSSKHTSVLL